MIIKLALLTCLFYILISVILEFALAIAMSHFKVGSIVGGRFGAWASVFCAVWITSFSAAFYVAFSSVRAKLPH